MTSKIKFVSVTRTIGPRSGIHYLDAIDEYGYHWSAVMSPHEEEWMCYTETWKKDPQQPWDL